MILKGNRIVVPKGLRRQMLRKAHDGHVGMEGSLRWLPEALYWPRMTVDAKQYVAQCDICQTIQDAPRKEPLIPQVVPTRPWAKIGVDLCDLNGRTLLVVIDYFSNYLEVCRLQQLTSAAVIRSLSEQFARWGVPDTLVSDNGRQFSSAEFATFAREWGFHHITSSPRYPQSNGKAENAVRTVKRLFAKCQHSGESEYRALLAWRNTPTAGMEMSPAQRIMGRRCRTALPCHGNLLEPRYPVARDAEDFEHLKRGQVRYYNRTASSARNVRVGDAVRMRIPGSALWSRGKCLRKVAPRSFEVEVDGSVYRRNQRHVHVATDGDSTEPADEEAAAISPCIEDPSSSPTDQEPVVSPALRRSSRISKPVARYGFDSPKKGGCDTSS